MRLLLSSLWLISFAVAEDFYYPDICNGALSGGGDGFTKPGLKMPKVGDSFRSKIQCNLGGDNGGRTIEEDEVFVSEKSRDRKRSSVIYRDVNTSMQIITDYLYGERLFIEQGPDMPRLCNASNLSTTMGRWIFNGTDGGVHAYTASAFLKMAETFKDETYLGKYMVRGISVNAWTMCYQWDSVKATFNITFFWSDPDLWTPAMYTPEKKDRSIPVSIKVEGKGKFGKNGQEKHILHEYDFIQFNEFEPDTSEFDIPLDTYCQNLPRAVKKLKLPKMFSFNSEVVTTEYEASVIFYQKHFYDSELNITRFDYKPFNDDYNSNIMSETGVVTRIHDFVTGISAEFDNYLGNCTIRPIPLDAGDADVTSGNKVRLVDPFTFIGIDNKIQFQYYRQAQHREIEALVYVGIQNFEQTSIVHEVWYALLTDRTEGQSKWVMNQPLRYLQYNLKDPQMDRIDMNIFHFDDDRPDISVYDVSICVDDKHRYTCSFELDGNAADILRTNRTSFQRQVLVSVLTFTGLSYLQISNFQFDSSRENTKVIFDLLDINVKGDGEVTKPGPSIENAMKSLEKEINKGAVLIGNPDQISKPLKAMNFKRYPLTEDAQLLYSSGSMALAAILSILAGALIGAGIIYCLVTKNKLTLPRSSDGFSHATFTNEPEVKP